MKLKVWQAINGAIRDAMTEDERVMVIGQDVGTPGGPYGMTRGLLSQFGQDRVRDAPISEAALMACAIGAAMMGLRPIVEVMFLDFIGLPLDQIVNQAAKYRFFNSRDKDIALPLVIHTLYGGRANMGAQHSQSLEAWLCHVPGLLVAFPSTPQDAYDILRNAIAEPSPVIVIESIVLLREAGDVEIGAARPQIGNARLVRQGRDLSVVSYGPAIRICEQALDSLGIDADLIDLRWLSPWDEEMVLASVAKTGRIIVVHDAVEAGGWGGEIIAQVSRKGFWNLDAPPHRVGADFSPIPVTSRDWKPRLPNVERVCSSIKEIMKI